MTDEYAGIQSLLELIEGKNYNTEKIKAAYLYANELHKGQVRQSGEAYISHPIAVSEIVASLDFDTDAICAALLHDTVEDCADKTSLSAIRERFGEDVATLVDGLTKIKNMDIEDKELTHIENLRKMLLAMAKDIRVIFIKLCDRLHNMRTLSAKKEDRQRAIALETMHVYAPIADRLGIQKIKQQLENISLYYLDPIGYREVEEAIQNKYGQSRECMKEATDKIEARLREEGVQYEIKGRVKSISSLYRKMYQKNKAFDEIHDFYAIRVLVNTEAECYAVLGYVHELFRSVPGRFKDYISTPKSNMYRSLHTTVMAKGAVPFEVQIRTFDMHHIAEYGIAAHWKYKSGSTDSSIDEELSWISKLLEANSVSHDVDEVIGSFKVDLFHDETFVFTPKGDLRSIPFGSNAIDFAYAIHTAIGNRMVGAKVNGVMVPIDTVLENGDIVEILTGSVDKGPSRDWLSIVKTSEARNKIRQWFKKEQRPDNILLGKSEVERELKKYNLPFTDSERDAVVLRVSARTGFVEIDDLYNAIGYGGVSMTKIAGKLREEFDKIVKPQTPISQPEEKKPAVTTQVRPKHAKDGSGVLIDGEGGCFVKFARCCNPLPGDLIVGFATKGFGVSVHKADCPNVVSGKKDPAMRDRWLEATWAKNAGDDGSVGGAYEALLHIHTYDDIGVLADISRALADMRVSIVQISSHQVGNHDAEINLTVSCKNTEHYRQIVTRLRAVPAVTSVERGFA